MNERILVVDDEKAIADLVGIYLKKEGFDVQIAYSGADAAKAILEQEFDLALLDVMLPDIDGFELLRTIRSSHTYPVIMLTARDAQQDKIEGLSLGADDYVVKPFRPLELIARVHAQLRRYTSYGSRAQAAESPTIQLDGLEINRDARSVTVDGAPVRLTPTEYSILLYLVEHRGSVVAVEDLFRGVERGLYARLQQYGDGAYSPLARKDRRRRTKAALYQKRLGRRLHNRITLFACEDLDMTKDDRQAFDVPDRLFEYVRSVVDNRALATVLLFLLSLLLIGIDNIAGILTVLLVGFLLIDRFEIVRRCMVIGGAAWAMTLAIGAMALGGIEGPVLFDAGFVFNMLGFVLALAVCVLFLCGRALYYQGYEQGEQHADCVLAARIQDRLIDHPDTWDNIDGDFLEVEGALNRVRDRERKVQQALRDESHRKDDLVTYLAHDLRTPLASVVGYLSLLQEAPELPVEQRARFTGVALDKAHRLDALIEEFFDITRFDFHDIVLTRAYVDLGLLLAQVADEFYPILNEQRKEAQVDIREDLTVLVDGDKMARVFNNIMRNAVAYSYEGSTITIEAGRQDDGGVRVRFINQGDPIPAAKLKVIFEKFYRLDAARATNRGGAGLGLAIAKEIIAAHGGTVACESTPEHTIFTIELPAA